MCRWMKPFLATCALIVGAHCELDEKKTAHDKRQPNRWWPLIVGVNGASLVDVHFDELTSHYTPLPSARPADFIRKERLYSSG